MKDILRKAVSIFTLAMFTVVPFFGLGVQQAEDARPHHRVVHRVYKHHHRPVHHHRHHRDRSGKVIAAIAGILAGAAIAQSQSSN